MAKKTSWVTQQQAKKLSLIEAVPTKPTNLWILLGSIFIVGLVILGAVSFLSWSWLRNTLFTTNSNTSSSSIITLNIQRSASYAGLNFTILNAQYATSFSDDDIHLGQATIRLNMRISNKTSDQIAVIYYDIARLLVPEHSPIAPTNVHLSAGPKSGASETGWLDFPIAKDIRLSTLKLQLGAAAGGETLVIIPFSGPFDASIYANRLSPQVIIINYKYGNYVLAFHLVSVDIGYGYRGNQSKAGQQFYVLNFLVDNTNNGDVSPGTGYDYVRLVLNGDKRPPIDTTLPTTFKAGFNGVGGRVAFAGPAGMKTLTIAFLLQVVPGEQDQNVRLI